RNHGASPHAPTMTYPEMAEDVLALIAGRRLGAPALVGHSMGGKVAMTAALAAPQSVGRLVVVDIAPVPHGYTPAAYAEAMAAPGLEGATRRAEVEAQLATAVPDPAIRSFLMQNLVTTPEGLRWRLDLAAIRRSMAAIAGFPERSGAYPGAALFVRGERS